MDYDDQILALQQLADKLEEGPLAELTEARRKIVALRGLVEGDPLAVKTEGESIAVRLQTTRARLEELQHSRDHLKADLAAARLFLEQLQVAHQAAKDAPSERRQKVQMDDATLPQPLDDAKIDALAPWLATLEEAHARGQWKPVRIGLGKWTAVARDYRAAAENVRDANLAPLRERDELRGLLDALKAKAKDRALENDAALESLAQQAWQLLHSRPTPLDRARQLVFDYQARLA
jgi:hypothetical protein